jgi:hypothetical protein
LCAGVGGGRRKEEADDLVLFWGRNEMPGFGREDALQERRE